MKKRYNIIISGRVQGVFFRTETRDHARKFNLKGWVKNNSNNTVEIIAEGEELNLMQFLKWCHQGPESARVENIRIKKQDYENEFEVFSIKY